MKNRIFIEGYNYLLALIVSFVISGILLIFNINYAGIMFSGTVFLLFFFMYFFRNPDININHNDGEIVSPASGKVFSGCEDISFYYEKDYNKQECEGDYNLIKIHLRPYDEHIQCAPIDGTIERIETIPRETDRERTRYTIRPSESFGKRSSMYVDQIVKKPLQGPYLPSFFTGKRNIPWVKEGQKVKKGDKIGMIRFGSQCTVGIPKDWNSHTKVSDNDEVKVGETPIAVVY